MFAYQSIFHPGRCPSGVRNSRISTLFQMRHIHTVRFVGPPIMGLVLAFVAQCLGCAEMYVYMGGVCGRG